MPNFILNKNRQPTGEHEVHNATNPCSPATYPQPQNRLSLGIHATCHGAVAAAKQANPSLRIDGCAHCCPACHNF